MDSIRITELPYNKKKVLVFTWDDANYTHLYMTPMFALNGMCATYFLNTKELERTHGFYTYL